MKFAENIRLGVAITTLNALSRIAAFRGDPLGRLDVPGASKNPYPTYETVRARGRLVKSRLGYWLTASHTVCQSLFASPQVSSTYPDPEGFLEKLLDPRVRAGTVDPFLDSFINKDAPDHTRLRRLVQRGFTPKAITEHGPMIERIAEELIATLPRNRPFDLIADFARPLPMRVITRLIGVPVQDERRFDEWGDALTTGLDRPRSLRTVRRMRRALHDMEQFFRALLAERRKKPANDLLSVLLEQADQGDCLTDDEVISTLGLILIAGFETTVNLLGTGTANLIQHRSELNRLAENPEQRVKGLVEECLRYDSPVQYTFRRAVAPLDLGVGPVIPAGEEVVLLLAGANRDPELFDHPEKFMIDRENARQHISFGAGAHFCLGASLARAEASIAWLALLQTFPDPNRWRLAGEPVWGESTIIRGLRSLPVVLG